MTIIAASTPVAAVFNSHNDQIVSELNKKYEVIGFILLIITELILIYTVLKFRNRDEAKPTVENRRLEITWTVTTAIVLVFVAASSYMGMAAMNDTPTQMAPLDERANSMPDSSDAVIVNVTGQQWQWHYEYPQYNVTSLNLMYLPVDKPVYLRVRSDDVLHSFAAPGLGWKVDAVPGRTNLISEVNITRKGKYQVYCTEYCGTSHSNMLGNITVTNDTRFKNWIKQKQ
ncbi:MAG: cytochrome c oxidase subunit II [Halobacteria archaeon]